MTPRFHPGQIVTTSIIPNATGVVTEATREIVTAKMDNGSILIASSCHFKLHAPTPETVTYVTERTGEIIAQSGSIATVKPINQPETETVHIPVPPNSVTNIKMPPKPKFYVGQQVSRAGVLGNATVIAFMAADSDVVKYNIRYPSGTQFLNCHEHLLLWAPKFKIGDFVISRSKDIYKIASIDLDRLSYRAECGVWLNNEQDLATAPTAKFKVGERVRFTDKTPTSYWFGPHTPYRTAVVVDRTANKFAVAIDGEKHGPLNVPPSMIEPHVYRVGDRVEIVELTNHRYPVGSLAYISDQPTFDSTVVYIESLGAPCILVYLNEIKPSPHLPVHNKRLIDGEYDGVTITNGHIVVTNLDKAIPLISSIKKALSK